MPDHPGFATLRRLHSAHKPRQKFRSLVLVVDRKFIIREFGLAVETQRASFRNRKAALTTFADARQFVFCVVIGGFRLTRTYPRSFELLRYASFAVTKCCDATVLL